MDRQAKGIAMAVIGATAYGFLPIITKFLLNLQVSSSDVLVSRFIIVLVFIGITLISKKSLMLPTKKQVRDLLIFAVLGYGGAIYLLTESCRYMPVSQATMIHFSYPFFVALLMVFFFKEKLTKLKVAALFLIALSLAFFIGSDVQVNFKGVALALISGLAFAAYLTSINQSSLKNLNTFNLMFYLALSVVTVFGAFAVVTGQTSLLSLRPQAYGYILVLGLTSIVGIGFSTMAVKTIGETYTAMLSLVEPVVSYLCGILIFSEELSLNSVAGSLIMLLVILAVISDERAIKRQRESKMDEEKKIIEQSKFTDDDRSETTLPEHENHSGTQSL